MYIYLFHIVRANACESFDPTIPDHMAAVEDDAATLAHLLQLRKYPDALTNSSYSKFFCVKNVVTNTKYIYPDYHGDNIEICTPKEGDRIIISGSLVALGAWGAKAAGSAAIGWGINKWFG